jgi:hypothetical protein
MKFFKKNDTISLKINANDLTLRHSNGTLKSYYRASIANISAIIAHTQPF